MSRICDTELAIKSAGEARIAMKQIEQFTEFTEGMKRQRHVLSEETTAAEDEGVLHAFVLIVQAVVKTRMSDEIQLFGRLMPNFGLEREPMACDESEYLIKAIDHLGMDEFRVLCVLEVQAAGVCSEPSWPQQLWDELSGKASSEVGIPQDKFPSLPTRASRLGSCAPVTGAYVGYETCQYHTTSMLDGLVPAVRDRCSGQRRTASDTAD